MVADLSHPICRAQGRRLHAERDLIEEAHQEVVAKLLARLQKKPIAGGSLIHFIRRVSFLEARRFYRGEFKHRGKSIGTVTRLTAGEESPLGALVHQEDRERVTQAFRRLPQEEREALQALLDAHGHNGAVAELALRWQCTRSHVYYRGERALEAIRKELGVVSRRADTTSERPAMNAGRDSSAEFLLTGPCPSGQMRGMFVNRTRK